MRLRLIATLLAWVCALLPSWTSAEDRVVVRGNYYREPSTRVLQPMIDVRTDVPDERLTLGAGYLLDAITSASISAGTMQVTGGDELFTEYRHEARGSIASRLGPWSLGASVRYSTETDYISRSVDFGVGREFLQRTLSISARYAFNADRVYRIINNLGERRPWCGGLHVMDCTGDGFGAGTNFLQVHYGALAYSHVVHKTLLVHASAEGAALRGPQGNPYRAGVIPNGFPEAHPRARNRLALTGGMRWIVPKAHMVIDPSYRYYVDDWDIQAHSLDTRLHFRMLRHVRLRLRYRFYRQSEAFFWRDDMIYSGEPGEFRSGDPKMDDFQSHTPGIQLTYELDGLARYQGLGWLERGWVQATYNHVIYRYDRGGSIYCGDGSRICTARLGSLAFSLAF